MAEEAVKGKERSEEEAVAEEEAITEKLLAESESLRAEVEAERNREAEFEQAQFEIDLAVETKLTSLATLPALTPNPEPDDEPSREKPEEELLPIERARRHRSPPMSEQAKAEPPLSWEARVRTMRPWEVAELIVRVQRLAILYINATCRAAMIKNEEIEALPPGYRRDEMIADKVVAWEWFFGPWEGWLPRFALEEACAVLLVHPDWIRRRVRAYFEKEKVEPPKFRLAPGYRVQLYSDDPEFDTIERNYVPEGDYESPFRLLEGGAGEPPALLPPVAAIDRDRPQLVPPTAVPHLVQVATAVAEKIEFVLGADALDALGSARSTV